MGGFVVYYAKSKENYARIVAAGWAHSTFRLENASSNKSNQDLVGQVRRSS
jgi:hypothetical protein